eukprot:Colp12_sorted_trinity150504_noHs@18107
MTELSSQTETEIQYHTLEDDTWGVPSWIDKDVMTQKIDAMTKLPTQIPYAGSVNYRNMCRWYSGFFFRHKALADFEWYWRLDATSKYLCDIPYDPFVYMQTHKKKYGFVVTIRDYQDTIPTLWDTAIKWAEQNNKKPTWVDFFSDDEGSTYNGCHFWSNFEIGSLDFFRSDEYIDLFTQLDKSGGFYYERWGDAPVHSVAVAILLNKSEVHYFDDIGYYHEPFTHCPNDPNVRCRCQCEIPNAQDIDFDRNSPSSRHQYSCLVRWDASLAPTA